MQSLFYHGVISAVTSYASAMATDLVLSAANVVMRDSSLSKIVGGATCAASGGYMLAKSGVVGILKNKMFGSSTHATATLHPGRVFVASAGATFMVYGLYHAASGIIEL